MRHVTRLRSLLAVAVIAVAAGMIFTGCTENARLQQALANANISLVGQDNAMGGHCDGLTLSGDTVVLTYNLWPEEAGEDLLEVKEVLPEKRNIARRGLKNILKKYDDVADAMVKTKSGFVYRQKYANGKVDVYLTPDEVEKALEQL